MYTYVNTNFIQSLTAEISLRYGRDQYIDIFDLL